MKILRRAALLLLLALPVLSMFPTLVTSATYDRQWREYPNVAPCRQFPLGTDEMGRDRLARLLYGMRLSLFLAPAAAMVSTLMAWVIGGVAGFFSGWCDRIVRRSIDLTVSLPWLFVLILVRGLLPLNVSPVLSVAITFSLLALVGWAPAARVVRANVRELLESDVVLQARAAGCYSVRILFVHMLPLLKPVLAAQFCIAVPGYILTEANLSLLGLGVSEPLPSWGNLLCELENRPELNTAVLAPLILLIVVVSCFHLAFSVKDVHS